MDREQETEECSHGKIGISAWTGQLPVHVLAGQFTHPHQPTAVPAPSSRHAIVDGGIRIVMFSTTYSESAYPNNCVIFELHGTTRQHTGSREPTAKDHTCSAPSPSQSAQSYSLPVLVQPQSHPLPSRPVQVDQRSRVKVQEPRWWRWQQRHPIMSTAEITNPPG